MRSVPERWAASTATDEVPLAVRYVRALLERHGLPKYRQSPWIAEALGLSYSQAHRRMTGASPWSLEDIERVAAVLGESLAQVIAEPERPSLLATLDLGPTRITCRLWVGEPIDGRAPGPLAAVRAPSGWSIVPADQATEGERYDIIRFEAAPSAQPARTIAVLDDDKDLADSICAHLQGNGYEALPFYAIADLHSAMRTRRMDGYIIDWIVGETSALQLIADVRAENPASPIVVLTAQVNAGLVDEADIAEAVSRHRIEFSEKPIRLSILAATLGRALTGQEPS
jgi:ActR/RegA family two-component response regulator